MDQELKAKWIAALRSGKYMQARGTLINGDGAMCCLGVLAHVQGVVWDLAFPRKCSMETSVLPHGLSAGVHEDVQVTLAHKNDEGASFRKIADWIEKNL